MVRFNFFRLTIYRLRESAGICATYMMFFLVLLTCAGTVNAQDRFSILYQEFDARPLDVNEKRLLQFGLALSEDYLGLLDGDWGKRSQRALDQYTWREFHRESKNLHVTAVVLNAAEIIADSGWQIQYISPLQISLLFPQKTSVKKESTGSFENWSDSESSISFSFARTGYSKTIGFHKFILSQNARQNEAYSVIKKTLIVSGVKTHSGKIIYARSNKIGSRWTTSIISAKRQDSGLLNAISASISVGQGQELFLPTNGYLNTVLELFVEIANEDTQPRNQPNSVGSERVGGGQAISSGTGFIVSADGDILTNAHVVSDCSRLFVDGYPATAREISDIFDLAIIRSPAAADKTIAVFADRPAALNSRVTASGFPYSNFLAGLNVTQGSVSSLQGIRGQNFQLQISAPVQPGNSGGPLINDFGQVVGVVVAKLSKEYTEQMTGTMPENINFAVRGEVAKLFLAQNGMNIEIGQNFNRRSAEEIGQVATEITVLIECK